MVFENLYSDQAKEPGLRMNNLQTHEQVSFSADKNYPVPNAVYGNTWRVCMNGWMKPKRIMKNVKKERKKSGLKSTSGKCRSLKKYNLSLFRNIFIK